MISHKLIPGIDKSHFNSLKKIIKLRQHITQGEKCDQRQQRQDVQCVESKLHNLTD